MLFTNFIAKTCKLEARRHDVRVPDEVRKCVVFVGLPVAGLPNSREQIFFIGTAFFVTIESR
jgi:hypothetical protein